MQTEEADGQQIIRGSARGIEIVSYKAHEERSHNGNCAVKEMSHATSSKEKTPEIGMGNGRTGCRGPWQCRDCLSSFKAKCMHHDNENNPSIE